MQSFEGPFFFVVRNLCEYCATLSTQWVLSPSYFSLPLEIMRSAPFLGRVVT